MDVVEQYGELCFHVSIACLDTQIIHIHNMHLCALTILHLFEISVKALNDRIVTTKNIESNLI